MYVCIYILITLSTRVKGVAARHCALPLSGGGKNRLTTRRANAEPIWVVGIYYNIGKMNVSVSQCESQKRNGKKNFQEKKY